MLARAVQQSAGTTQPPGDTFSELPHGRNLPMGPGSSRSHRDDHYFGVSLRSAPSLPPLTYQMLPSNGDTFSARTAPVYTPFEPRP